MSFKSSFRPSSLAHKILREGRIISSDETPHAMIERVISTLFNVETQFGTATCEIEKLIDEFGAFLDGKYCVMSTPIMTNAGRYADKPLSACTVPPVNLCGDLWQIKQIVDAFHEDGMGTGFNLNDTKDPVRILRFLNGVAVDGANSGREDRPVGNMATLSIHHPKILEFIDAKADVDKRNEVWKFNISVDATAEFINAVEARGSYTLFDGTLLDARKVMCCVAKNAAVCGDPGFIFIDRLNRDNPTPGVGLYTSTAPCGEVGLMAGESCQFGYINLGKFINGRSSVNYGELERVTRLMVRSLDDALEFSMERYAHPLNKKIMSAKRKIGVGVCGLADAFLQLGFPYDSPQARRMAKDMIAFVNYISKLESHELAKKRGSFTAMNLTIGNRYRDNPGFIEEKYGSLDTSMVTSQMWRELGTRIRGTRLLRNASTVALPPTGRSALVIDASTGIEPLFSLTEHDGGINPFLFNELRERRLLVGDLHEKISQIGQIGNFDQIPEEVKNVYKTALEIDAKGHLLMVGELQQVVDESISKTINMFESATPEDVFDVYLQAYRLGLKGITIFRTGSRKI